MQRGDGGQREQVRRHGGQAELWGQSDGDHWLLLSRGAVSNLNCQAQAHTQVQIDSFWLGLENVD